MTMKIINWTYGQGFLVLFLCAIAFTSCEKYIDIDEYVYDKMTIDSIFISKTRTFEYINGTAEYLKNESKYIGDWYDDAKTASPSGLGADEAIQPWADDNHPGTKLVIDQITPRNTANVNPWSDYYKGIRKANIILTRIGENNELTDSEIRDYKGLTYFLRAYFYYSLVRLYGPVPILPDTPFDTDESVENTSFERSSFDDCVEYICADLEKAANLLPRDREITFQYLPTKGAALAVMARLRLYSASPLYNGNTYYSNWKRSDGIPFISQVADPTRWGMAAAAFKRIIDMQRYQLNTIPKIVSSKGTGTLELPETSDPDLKTKSFPEGAMDIDPYKSYKSVFDGTVRPENNPELIYFCVRSSVDDNFYFPSKLGGNSTFSVTQDMVDQYRMADGRQYSEAAPEEKSWEAVGSGLTFSNDYILSADRAKMHDMREPRFYASIGFNHCIWPATSYRGSDNNIKNFNATYYKDGNARGDNFSYNRTGYTCRKWAHQEDYIQWEGSRKSKTYPIFRYAEVLLGYVEAMNEMEGSYTDETEITVTRDVNEMVYYFNQIRYRAGLPGITTAEASDYETMKSLIKQEWQVEFFLEDHRYFDLRRWMDAPNAYRKPVTGLDVSAKAADRQSFYTVRVWNTETAMKRVWNNKMYFFPINQNVLDKNAKLEQNPGW
jgi:starch-binding outer membrane protein, SusD/RagB family